ncbi:hypothetical protein [uncultured Oscillibacter sp.]|uniref:hypothetical protein n=1 Tax=uncultured Oscillibacter sp. TaxID=876091 RepID=UPI0026374E04|nr:hypothetical protein [uncultured Oscillibacter sp.]
MEREKSLFFKNIHKGGGTRPAAGGNRENFPRFDKTSCLQNRAGRGMLKQEAFQYPTRLGRAARIAGRLLFISGPPEKNPAGL